MITKLEMEARGAQNVEIQHLARVWYDAWQDAHALILPAELIRIRTLQSFEERLHEALPDLRVVGPVGAPVGLCITRGDEIYQMFVSANARGSGVAARLLADAEARLSKRGVEVAWLACAIGNYRAARFYEKCGWHLVRTMVSDLETPGGIFPLEVWRYEKSLKRDR